MSDKNCICPKCGGNLVIEYIGNYGIIYNINKNGSIGRRKKRIMYESSGDYMVYCESCGTGYDGRLINETFLPFYEGV